LTYRMRVEEVFRVMEARTESILPGFDNRCSRPKKGDKSNY